MRIMIEKQEGVMPHTKFDYIAYEYCGDELLCGTGSTPEEALKQFLWILECEQERVEALAEERRKAEERECYLEDLAKARRRGELD